MTPTLAMASSSLLSPKLGACALSLSTSITPLTKIQPFHLSSWLSPLGRRLFSPWSGLKHLGISAKPKPLLRIGNYQFNSSSASSIIWAFHFC
jgi:hypothetical protein